ncbi:CRE-SRG-32 protein [Caenorhabditis remanei]|uniref:Serpentine receptor class gamma n=1 Tax=Caenorhabditis remanei TaxID=31234 RepID=E3MQV8_CAERE|nr:CRE-SRG-32 protein [Caenorhabditis remanei]
MLTVQFLITTAYGAASFYLYTLIVYMMIRRWNEYNTTFFKIFIIEYCFNLITFVNSFITLRAPQNTCKECVFAFLFDRSSNPTVDNSPLQYFFTLHYAMAYIQYSMTFLMALNRLSMVVLVNSYEKYWKPALPFFIAVIVIYPMYMTWPIASNNAYYLYTPPMGAYATKSVVDVTDILNNLIYFMLGITILTAVANVLAVIRLGCLPSRISGAERNLFTVSFVSAIIQLLALGDTLILRFGVSDAMSVGTQTAKVLMPFVSDLLTLNHPWTLMYFSTKVRLSMANDHFPSLRKRISNIPSSVY